MKGGTSLRAEGNRGDMNGDRNPRQMHARDCLRAVASLQDYWWSMIFSENRHPLFGIML